MSITCHEIAWDKCLSHQIWPAIKEGWQDTGKDVHFFWGLAGKNIAQIRQCMEWGLEWWYVDVGYITEQITRYPLPIINDYDKTYFRICKGGIHTTSFKEHDDKRLNTEFKGWQSGEHILVCPSSPTVSYYINDMTQEDWIKETTDKIKDIILLDPLPYEEPELNEVEVVDEEILDNRSELKSDEQKPLDDGSDLDLEEDGQTKLF